jgi:hypothetical protein
VVVPLLRSALSQSHPRTEAYGWPRSVPSLCRIMFDYVMLLGLILESGGVVDDVKICQRYLHRCM